VLHNFELHILPDFDYTKKNKISINIYQINSKSNHGFGIHGFITTKTGHGVNTHAQAGPHGARVAIAVVVVLVVVVVVLVVVVVVVVVITEKKENNRHNIKKNVSDILC